MQAYISERSENLTGRVKLPGDKSISHRSLMFSALGAGEAKITGLLEGEDVIATADALRAMGCDIRKEDDIWYVSNPDQLQSPHDMLYMGNSGTTTRLMMGLVAGQGVSACFTGDASLSKRPMGRVTKPLAQMGVEFKVQKDTVGRDILPITVIPSDKMEAIDYVLPVASAQAKSAILLAALGCEQEVSVTEPKATRDHTERMLKGMGADIKTESLADGAMKITIKSGNQLTNQDIDVPGDPSSAAFVIAAALLVPGSDVTIENMCMNPTRTGFVKTAQEMGADITFENERDVSGEKVADVRVKYTQRLNAVSVPAERAAWMIDEYPILFVLCSFAKGESYMPGLDELRVKESDRLAIMAENLTSCGVALIEGKDDLKIIGSDQVTGGAKVSTHLDHRIAMSFLIMGMATDRPIEIDDIAPIRTSFPDFIDLMTGLGAKFSPSSF